MILYIIRGLPGSGKTTFAKRLGCFNVEADMFFYQEGKYEYFSTLSYFAYSWCVEKVESAMNENIDVSVSNTFTTKKEMSEYIQLAQKYGYKIIIYHMHNNFESVHNVPEELIKKMSDRWEQIPGELILKSSRTKSEEIQYFEEK